MQLCLEDLMSSDIIVTRSLMKDHEGLIPVQVQPEFSFVVDCPSLHIVSGDNIGPRRQAKTDVRLKLFMYFILLAQDDLN
jgi:hypothetical protein